MALRHAILTVSALGCSSKSDAPPTRLAAAPSPRPTEAGPPATGASVDGEEPQTSDEMERPVASKLCRAFDRQAVAKAMGWSSMHRVGSMGSSLDRGQWSCHFMAKDHPDGAGFGVTFTATLPFMDSHMDAPYMRRKPIAGHEAVVAKHADGKFVSIQVHALGITVETNVNDAGPPQEVEIKLEDATSKLLSTLALDPAAALKE